MLHYELYPPTSLSNYVTFKGLPTHKTAQLQGTSLRVFFELIRYSNIGIIDRHPHDTTYYINPEIVIVGKHQDLKAMPPFKSW